MASSHASFKFRVVLPFCYQFTQVVLEKRPLKGVVIVVVVIVLACICCQVAHSEFTQANDSNQSGVTREQKLKELAAAYDSFSELRGNLEEGTKVCL